MTSSPRSLRVRASASPRWPALPVTRARMWSKAPLTEQPLGRALIGDQARKPSTLQRRAKGSHLRRAHADADHQALGRDIELDARDAVVGEPFDQSALRVER